MKTVVLIALSLIASQFVIAQPTWTIKHNNKALLIVKTENETKNIIKIKTPADSICNRSVMIADSSGNTIG